MKPVVGKGARFRDQMFAAAKSDLEPDVVDRPVEQVGEIGRAGAAISSESRGSRCSIRSAWCARSLWPLRRPKNEPCG